MDDELLLEQARQGDSAAFTSLVERHQDDLYTMALRLLGTPADAADVVQETFLRAYMNLPKLRGVSVRGWLFRVAVNACRDVQRRSVRKPASPLEDRDGKVLELPSQDAGPEAAAEARERAAAIRAALLALPVDYRVAVVLRDVNDLSYEEIAEVLHLPLGTVKSRLSRARLQLAGHLRRSTVLFAAEGQG
ncbi:MAG TPA: sigma-70 family RNA polymerase sigma factor [Candidatus Dormibacteraeota bacterium]|jgi:RNA polymerase sigma-70 factor (ECF subfamily)|nr:sigma-70 family RNA polymerase sigma factor [Candidatus Dormibacteraeota bacterium]